MTSEAMTTTTDAPEAHGGPLVAPMPADLPRAFLDLADNRAALGDHAGAVAFRIAAEVAGQSLGRLDSELTRMVDDLKADPPAGCSGAWVGAFHAQLLMGRTTP